VSAPTRLRRDDLITSVANVLDAGRTTALRAWDKDRCDIYHCAERAWRAQGMVVPLAVVHNLLRQVVPDGTPLEYQDAAGRTRADIAAKFTEARSTLLSKSTDTMAAPARRAAGAGARRW
jgi:WhiB family redox-sensing transcriptional regulator